MAKRTWFHRPNFECARQMSAMTCHNMSTLPKAVQSICNPCARSCRCFPRRRPVTPPCFFPSFCFIPSLSGLFTNAELSHNAKAGGSIWIKYFWNNHVPYSFLEKNVQNATRKNVLDILKACFPLKRGKAEHKVYKNTRRFLFVANCCVYIKKKSKLNLFSTIHNPSETISLCYRYISRA